MARPSKHLKDWRTRFTCRCGKPAQTILVIDGKYKVPFCSENECERLWISYLAGWDKQEAENKILREQLKAARKAIDEMLGNLQDLLECRPALRDAGKFELLEDLYSEYKEIVRQYNDFTSTEGMYSTSDFIEVKK